MKKGNGAPAAAAPSPSGGGNGVATTTTTTTVLGWRLRAAMAAVAVLTVLHLAVSLASTPATAPGGASAPWRRPRSSPPPPRPPTAKTVPAATDRAEVPPLSASTTCVTIRLPRGAHRGGGDDGVSQQQQQPQSQVIAADVVLPVALQWTAPSSSSPSSACDPGRLAWAVLESVAQLATATSSPPDACLAGLTGPAKRLLVVLGATDDGGDRGADGDCAAEAGRPAEPLARRAAAVTEALLAVRAGWPRAVVAAASACAEAVSVGVHVMPRRQGSVEVCKPADRPASSSVVVGITQVGGRTCAWFTAAKIPAGGAVVLQRHDARDFIDHASVDAEVNAAEAAHRVRVAAWRFSQPGDQSPRGGATTAAEGGNASVAAVRRAKTSFFRHGPLRAAVVIPSQTHRGVDWLTAGGWSADPSALRQLVAAAETAVFSKFSTEHYIRVDVLEADTLAQVDHAIASRLPAVDILVVPAGSVVMAFGALAMAPGTVIMEIATPSVRPLFATLLLQQAHVTPTTVLLMPQAGFSPRVAHHRPGGKCASVDASGTSAWALDVVDLTTLRSASAAGGCDDTASATDSKLRTGSAAGGATYRGMSHQHTWYHAIKTATSEIWTQRARFLDIHAFDTRK